jgi:hypothetical protein
MEAKQVRTIEKITREILHLEKLETRHSDGLDLSEQAVWALMAASDWLLRPCCGRTP